MMSHMLTIRQIISKIKEDLFTIIILITITNAYLISFTKHVIIVDLTRIIQWKYRNNQQKRLMVYSKDSNPRMCVYLSESLIVVAVRQ